MILPSEIQKIVNKVAKDMGLSNAEASVAYRSFWLFIKDKIENFPDLTTITEEELRELKSSFNLPSLGKFSTTMRRINGINARKRIVSERTNIKKNKTTS